MAVPILKLDLAPPSNYWRLNHVLLSWAALALGGLILAGSLGFTWIAYQEASRAGKLAVSLANKTRTTADSQSRVLAELRGIDVTKELPRWRLAERIYTERSLPWTRLTAELERSLVKDVRIKSIQRNRGADLKVQLKLSGEARSRDAEAAFMESLQKNAFFEQVILEREGDRAGGGVDFNCILAAKSNPPAYSSCWTTWRSRWDACASGNGEATAATTASAASSNISARRMSRGSASASAPRSRTPRRNMCSGDLPWTSARSSSRLSTAPSRPSGLRRATACQPQ